MTDYLHTERAKKKHTVYRL